METHGLPRFRRLYGSTLLKKLIHALSLAFLISTNVIAESAYPRDTFFTASSWEGEIGITEGGFGAHGMMAIDSLPFPHITGEIHAGYRWIEEHSSIISIPNAGFAAGYRFPVFSLFSLTPLAGINLIIPVSDGTPSVAAELTASLRVSVRLADRNYLTLTPSFSYPFSSIVKPRVAISVGTRREIPWIRPIAPVNPKIAVQPSLFSPDGDGNEDSAILYPSAKHPKNVASWNITVLSPDGKPFKSFGEKGKLPKTINWDGRSAADTEAEPAFDYRIVLETTDILGRVQKTETTVTVDILVIQDGDRYKIRVSDIRFPSYSYELSEKESRSLLNENKAVLERIATLFTRFPDYTLTVEGYANAVNWNDAKKMKVEQEETLIPLSKMRAETVKQALVMLGVADTRIRAVGLGALRPIVPFSDTENIWKNRRVEFILSKEKP